MTAKQKTAQLRYKFSILLDLNTTDKKVLECTLLAVNEIIEAFLYQKIELQKDFLITYNYWQEVKKEIRQEIKKNDSFRN